MGKGSGDEGDGKESGKKELKKDINVFIMYFKYVLQKGRTGERIVQP